MRKIQCAVCGYIYDEAAGYPKIGITPGTKWENIPSDFVCPMCSASKSAFRETEENIPEPDSLSKVYDNHFENLKELSAGEISAVCSSLAKSCDKQQLFAEMRAFNSIADYFKTAGNLELDKTLEDAAKMLDEDITIRYPSVNNTAKANVDKDTLRSLVWSEKVSILIKSLLERFVKEGESMLANTGIFVCDICGFIHIGDNPPETCPVCKVQSYKFIQVERS